MAEKINVQLVYCLDTGKVFLLASTKDIRHYEEFADVREFISRLNLKRVEDIVTHTSHFLCTEASKDMTSDGFYLNQPVEIFSPALFWSLLEISLNHTLDNDAVYILTRNHIKEKHRMEPLEICTTGMPAHAADSFC